MKRWLILLFFVPNLAWGTCVPSQAIPGMIGCWPVVTSMSGTSDYFDIWQPGPFPASANLISPANVFKSPPPIGATSPNAGFFTNLNATSLISSLPTGVVSGQAGGFLGTSQPWMATWQAVSWTGTITSGVPSTVRFNTILASDSVNNSVSPVGGTALLSITEFIGGSAKVGSATMIDANMDVNQPTGNNAFLALYLGFRSTVGSSVNDHGTISAPNGAILAGNIVANLGPTATFWVALQALEVDVNAEAGSSVAGKNAIKIALLNLDAVHGSGDDAALNFDNAYAQGAGAGWNILIEVGGGGGAFPLSTTGVIMKATRSGNDTTVEAATGIDLTAVTFSVASLALPGMTVGPTGNVFAPAVITNGTGNNISLASVVSGNTPFIQTFGADTNIPINLKTKGVGGFIFSAYAGAEQIFGMASVVNAISYPLTTAAASGGQVTFDVGGTPGAMTIAGSNATALNLGESSITTTIGGSIKVPNVPTTCSGHSGFVAAVSNVLTLCP